MQNGSFDHLIGQLDSRLERIEQSIDRLTAQVEHRHEQLNGRVRKIEDRHSEQRGGWTVLTVIGSVAGVVGGYASKWLGW